MAKAKTKSNDTSSVSSVVNTGTSLEGALTISTPSNSSTPKNENQQVFEMFNNFSINIDQLKKQVSKLEKEQEKQAEFFYESSKLSKVSRIAIILLFILPILQLVACAIIVYKLGIQNQFPVLRWIIGGASLFAIIDIVYVFINLNENKKRLDELEKKVKSISEAQEK